MPGIRCNVIAPGHMVHQPGVTVPFGCDGIGWEIAYTALFLISNEKSYVDAHPLCLMPALWLVSWG
jgi:hypothetical protein